MHTVKALSKLTGIKPDTIRTWERRYGVLVPSRDENGHRTYSNGDVDRLGLISKLVQSGQSISRLAGLDHTQLLDLHERSQCAPPDKVLQQTTAALRQAIESQDFERFRYLIGTTLMLNPPLTSTEQVIAPCLRTIGELWLDGTIDIGLEHRFTHIIKQQLLSALASIKSANSGPVIAFTTLSGERHELGALMACYIAAAQGCNCHYFGPDMPVNDLVRNVVTLNADILAVSLVLQTDGEDRTRDISYLADNIPERIRIWAGVGGHIREQDLQVPDRIETFASFQPFVRELKVLSP